MFGGLHRHFSKHFGHGWSGETREDRRAQDQGAHIQMARSCTGWSAGKPTEHSIANAYIDAITNAQKFVYIENQVNPFSFWWKAYVIELCSNFQIVLHHSHR